VEVQGDRHRLRQLLLNLTDNAVKYNQPEGSVTIELRGEGNGDTAELKISNTGAGIPAEALPRVFDRFYRGNTSQGSGIDGCGLGLSISQWIAGAHAGRITLESEPGKETIATVRLPVNLKSALE
jgi:signal transduction histidine kinase